MTEEKKDFAFYSRSILLKQFIVAVLICVVATIISPENLRAWVLGALASFLDNCLMLFGVNRGSKQTPEVAVVTMQRNKFIRLAVFTAIVLVMLKMRLPVIGVFISFILLHIFFLFSVSIIANRKKTGS